MCLIHRPCLYITYIIFRGVAIGASFMIASSGAPRHVLLVRCAPVMCASNTLCIIHVRLVRCASNTLCIIHVRLVIYASSCAPRHVRLVRCASSCTPRDEDFRRESRLVRKLSGDGKSACDEGFRRESRTWRGA